MLNRYDSSLCRTVEPIKTEADYENALERVSQFMDAKPNTAEEDELNVLATLVEAYEDQHYPMGCPNVVEAIAPSLEQHNRATL